MSETSETIQPDLDLHRLTVKLGPSGRGSIELDGKKIKNCRGLSIHCASGEATTVSFDLIAVHVDFDVENVRTPLAETTSTDSNYKEYRHAAYL